MVKRDDTQNRGYAIHATFGERDHCVPVDPCHITGLSVPAAQRWTGRVARLLGARSLRDRLQKPTQADPVTHLLAERRPGSLRESSESRA